MTRELRTYEACAYCGRPTTGEQYCQRLCAVSHECEIYKARVDELLALLRSSN